VKSQLLPEGFRDSLPDLAVKEEKINSFFINLMKKNGYLLVRPPLLEFESSLFFLLEDNNDKNSFRVLDPISQKMMGIRSDITLQIARIACGSLANYPRPLRLCYSGEILKVNNNSLNLSRQEKQIGSEIIGVGNKNCENQVLTMIFEILNKLKIKNFVINFTMPTLINAISKDFNLSKNQIEFIKNKFRNKNTVGLEKISKSFEIAAKHLLDCVGDASENLKKLKKKKFTKNISFEVSNFINIITRILKDFPTMKILIDPLEVDESNYHTGLAFKVFSKSFKELFTGGNYSVSNENCIGFSGYIESLIKESKIISEKQKKIFIPFDLKEKKKKKLQTKSYITLQAIKPLNKNQLIKNAKIFKCSYYYENKKIIKLD